MSTAIRSIAAPRPDLATRVAPVRRPSSAFPAPHVFSAASCAPKVRIPLQPPDSLGGRVALMSPVDVEAGERIVAYFDQFGGIEGTVARTFEGGFAIRLATQHKREKLAAQIMWLINRHELSSAEDRRHERIPIGNKLTSLKLAEGIVVDVRVIDISLSGASIATTARPAFGAELLLGKHRVRVMRHHDNGIGVQFIDIQEPEALRRYFD